MIGWLPTRKGSAPSLSRSGNAVEKTASCRSASRPIAAALILAGLLSVKPALADKRACSAAAAQKVCSCDLTKLRPLQGAVGMKEVAYKKRIISDDTKHQRKKLKKHPIEVVIGPGGQLFITDHHHGAKAWLGAKTKWRVNGLCKVVNFDKELPSDFGTDEDQFWKTLKDRKLVWLKNERGVDIDASQLPKTLEAMPDDPYRSLAWFVRKKRGFCKSRSEFAEFAWADWFRSKFPNLDAHDLPSNPKNKKNQTVNEAVKFAHSQKAKNLPGHSDADCKKDDED
jgi:hypothetical protein